MLAEIRYAMRKNKSTPITMRGLNLSSMISDGDVVDSKNISLRKFPYMTSGLSPDNVIDDGTVSTIGTFKGELMTVRGNKLYKGDEEIGDLNEEEKDRTLVPINSKLVVFPDRKYYDGESTQYDSERVKDLWAETQAAMLFSSSSVSLLTGVESCIWGYGGTLQGNKLQTEPNEPLVYSEFDAVATGRTNGKDKLIALLDVDVPLVKVSQYENLGHVDTYVGGVNSISYICNKSGHVPLDGHNVYLDASKHGDFYSVEETYVDKSGTSLREVSLKLTLVGAPGFEVDFSDLTGKITFYEPFRPNRAPQNTEGTFIRYSVAYGDPGSLHRFHKLDNVYGICSVEDPKNRISIGLNYTGSYFEWALWKDSFSDFAEGDKVTLFYPDIPYLAKGTVKSATQNSITFSDLGGVPWLMAESGKEPVYILPGDGVSYADLSNYKAGDVVEISGVTIDGAEANNTAFSVDNINGAMLYATADIFTEGVANLGEDKTVTVAKLERRIPELDFVCEKDNRIYGCSNADNTIYVSALGDPTNMFAYEGVSTDSYAVAVGSDGAFTGCCKHGTSVLFFKENKIYKLMGSYPAEYTLYEYDVDGVEAGSHQSLASINEVLYYKGRRGVFSYAGDIPRLISENFGEKLFDDAAAGTDGESYLISMKGEDDKKPYLYSYNTRLGMWTMEGYLDCKQFARLGAELYYLESDRGVYTMHSVADPGVEWHVQFAPIYETMEGHKIYSRIKMRAELPRGSYLKVRMRCDGGAWADVGTVVGKAEGVIPVMIPICRCDKFELRLEGKGPFTVHSMLREYYVSGAN
jgi:hypothetical protein